MQNSPGTPWNTLTRYVIWCEVFTGIIQCEVNQASAQYFARVSTRLGGMTRNPVWEMWKIESKQWKRAWLSAKTITILSWVSLTVGILRDFSLDFLLHYWYHWKFIENANQRCIFNILKCILRLTREFDLIISNSHGWAIIDLAYSSVDYLKKKGFRCV